MARCSFAWRLGLPLLLLGSILVRAQTNAAVTRIQVKRSGPIVTVEGDVERNKEVVYVFQAKAGLKFSGHLTTKSGKAGFAVAMATAFPKKNSTSIPISVVA